MSRPFVSTQYAVYFCEGRCREQHFCDLLTPDRHLFTHWQQFDNDSTRVQSYNEKSLLN
jgi:hypothetical protein